MKNVWNACSGFLPSAENSTKPATMVSTAAMSGDRYPISRDGSARASSSSRMARFLVCRRDMRGVAGIGPHAAHPYADFLDGRVADGLRGRQAALGDDGEPVAHLEELVELLGYDENGRAVVAEIDDLLPDERRGADIH